MSDDADERRRLDEALRDWARRIGTPEQEVERFVARCWETLARISGRPAKDSGRSG
jgi:hypothetical protein